MGDYVDELNFLRVFSELRDSYPDVETAIEITSVNTKIDLDKLLCLLSAAGVYVLPDSETEREIRRFISSVDKTKTTVDELGRMIGFYFCISDREGKRLAEKWFNCSDDITA